MQESVPAGAVHSTNPDAVSYTLKCAPVVPATQTTVTVVPGPAVVVAERVVLAVKAKLVGWPTVATVAYPVPVPGAPKPRGDVVLGVVVTGSVFDAFEVPDEFCAFTVKWYVVPPESPVTVSASVVPRVAMRVPVSKTR